MQHDVDVSPPANIMTLGLGLAQVTFNLDSHSTFINPGMQSYECQTDGRIDRRGRMSTGGLKNHSLRKKSGAPGVEPFHGT